jgi:hypothetical protein
MPPRVRRRTLMWIVLAVVGSALLLLMVLNLTSGEK